MGMEKGVCESSASGKVLPRTYWSDFPVAGDMLQVVPLRMTLGPLNSCFQEQLVTQTCQKKNKLDNGSLRRADGINTDSDTGLMGTVVFPRGGTCDTEPTR